MGDNRVWNREVSTMVKLDEWERQNMITVLGWRTQFSEKYLKSLTDAELDKLYRERVGE